MTTRRAVRAAWSIATGAGLMLWATPVLAAAQDVTGGCSVSINGRDATELTRDDPLSVYLGQSVTFEGTSPLRVAGAAVTQVSAYALYPLAKVSAREHTSRTEGWKASVDISPDLPGVGLYQLEARARGFDWRCTTTAYIHVEGDPLTKPVGRAAVAAVLVGIVGVVVSPRAGRTALTRLRRGRIRGRPILGVAAGALFGAGVAVLLQQYGMWTLTLMSAIAAPAGLGLVTGSIAWWGRRDRGGAHLAAALEDPEGDGDLRDEDDLDADHADLGEDDLHHDEE